VVTRGATELVSIARTVLEDSDYGFLITSSSTGPDARLVKHLSVSAEFDVWIGTSAYSRKARQAAHRVPASFAVESRRHYAYVVLKGAVDLVTDVAERVARWQDSLAMFFPGGPESDEFALLRCTTARVELMSFGHKVHPAPLGLVPAVLERSDSGWTEVSGERWTEPPPVSERDQSDLRS
jgi:general stress protein 26